MVKYHISHRRLPHHLYQNQGGSTNLTNRAPQQSVRVAHIDVK